MSGGKNVYTFLKYFYFLELYRNRIKKIALKITKKDKNNLEKDSLIINANKKQ